MDFLSEQDWDEEGTEELQLREHNKVVLQKNGETNFRRWKDVLLDRSEPQQQARGRASEQHINVFADLFIHVFNPQISAWKLWITEVTGIKPTEPKANYSSLS